MVAKDLLADQPDGVHADRPLGLAERPAAATDTNRTEGTTRSVLGHRFKRTGQTRAVVLARPSSSQDGSADAPLDYESGRHIVCPSDDVVSFGNAA